MAVSAAAAAHCVSPDSFNHSLSITNFDKNRCFNRTTSYEPWGATNYWTCHEYWFTNVPNITAIPPVAVEDDLATWLYQSESELNSSLPAAKPLLIDCPMPVCVFGISGPYADLQRWLIYANLGFALLASAAPILRGVAQIYLATTSISATVHFWVMYSLQDKGFVDMDVLPSLLYGISGIVASQLWLLLRRQHVKRTRDFFFYVLLPYSMVFLYFPIASALLIHYSQNPGTVLLESDAAFRLTSICYQDSTGSAALWSGPDGFDYGIRQLSELLFILPPNENDGKPAVVSPIPRLAAVGIFMAVVAMQHLFLLLLAFHAKCMCSCEGRSRKINLSFLGRLPGPIQRFFSPDFSPDWVKKRDLVVGNSFFFVLVLFAVYLAGFLVLAILMELGISKHKLPQGEARYQYSQWGTWVLAFFVALATIFIRFQPKQSDPSWNGGLIRVRTRRLTGR